MREIKAFIHAHRVSDVLQALKQVDTDGAQISNFAVFPVQALLHDTELKEARYSVSLGETVINEFKIEILCHEEAVPNLVEVIQRIGHAGDHEEGWIIVTDVLSAVPVGKVHK
ncbi:MAG TPA: P-II family nitrogen regulator [Methylotenera sp.]|nr:P-II family nitrogen regulator [Methylotenera sp.]